LVPVRLAALAALSLALSLARPAHAEASEWRVDGSSSQLTVHVFRSGGLSHFLHDHFFRPQTLSGQVTFDPANPATARVHLSVDARTIADHQPELKPDEEAKVNEQARGPTVLDVAKFPEITFDGTRLEKVSPQTNALSAVLVGTVTIHGVTRPVTVPIQASWSGGILRATGSAHLKQSDFGIKPLHKGLGSIAVKDDFTVDFDIKAKQ
jgi:polyisoprenoid-binding protein YceI